MEADELWSFVGHKGEQCWVWAALDADSRQVVALVAGDRSAATAQALWDALPDDYRDEAVVRTDFWSAYQAAVPAEQLYVEGPMANEFARTVSRIVEMQSKEYLETPRRMVDTSLT